jgi:hypothetical protein
MQSQRRKLPAVTFKWQPVSAVWENMRVAKHYPILAVCHEETQFQADKEMVIGNGGMKIVRAG